MIRSVCCVCGHVYGTRIDGQAEVRDSHGYCQKHYDEAMIEARGPLAELEGDRRAA